jgi:hypothetical protein
MWGYCSGSGKKLALSSLPCERESNAAEIDDFTYAQCVTYIGSEVGKTLDHDVWTGGETLRA